jgi:Cof subfamily protein (haloacid dehalogenase superfamily)
MIALDVDGTIAGPDFTVPPATRDAICEAAEAGAIVTLATGRMRRSALKYAQVCGTNGPVICYQGAVTASPDGASDLRHVRLPQDVVGQALDGMRSQGVHINFFLDDQIYLEDASEWANGYAGRMGVEPRVVKSLDEVAGEGPTVVMGVDKPERITALTATLKTSLNGTATVTHSLPQFCEVASAAAGKDAALKHLAQQLGIAREEVIAAGDGLGDVPMLRWAGLGVSVESAHPEARAAASLIVAGPEHDGIGRLIRELLREGKLSG